MAPENALERLPFTQLGLVELYLIYAMRKPSAVVAIARPMTPQGLEDSVSRWRFRDLLVATVKSPHIIFAPKYQDDFQRDDLSSSYPSS